MKMASRWCAALLLTCPVGAYRRGGLRAHGEHDSRRSLGHSRMVAAGVEAQEGAQTSAAGLRAKLESMVHENLFGSKGPSMGDIARDVHGKMDIDDALQQLNGKLPADVASLARLATKTTKSTTSLDEASMQKARRILNGMMEQAWAELDDVVFECKEFQMRNRGTYEQVVADLGRLGSQLANLGQFRVTSEEGEKSQDLKRTEATELLGVQKSKFTAIRFENQNQLTIQKNDLAVFDFILNLTSCNSNPGASFVQLGAETVQSPAVRICDTGRGPELNFDDPKLQAKVERLMTPDAQRSLREALGQFQNHLSLLQTVNMTTTAVPTYAVETVPVSEAPHPAGQWKKCLVGPSPCGLLHDLMSIEWGRFKDSFDELTAEMKSNQDEFDTLKSNINDELVVISDEKTKHMELLATTISSINADTLESTGKEEQKLELTHEYDHKCALFRAKIAEILFARICATRKVRNALLVNSNQTPPSNFSDCDFSDWTSKTGECIAPNGVAILCDDNCPNLDPFKCGGKEVLVREIVVAPDASGMKCPPLSREMRCGQKKCPIDCLMSQWSGWSKCTKECESGVKTMTRSVITKPKEGGFGCDAVQQETSCNTGTCDRNCKLREWSEWSPCSMACGGGLQTRNRAVLVPIRGLGKCPKTDSRNRLQEKKCNFQDCVGDEICIAQQDLILAIDASGSLRQDGFDVVRTFAANLTDKYKSQYFGIPAMSVGVALFGNGELITLPDGTTSVSPARNIQPLTHDLDLVKNKINDLTWQRGFTNMAQALTLAGTMLAQGGRMGAQSAVLVLSDGKFSFKYQTAEKARELKDQKVQIYMAPIMEFEGEELAQLKKWASQPWKTNYERIPGLESLKFNSGIFAQKLISKFCPDSMSPSLQLALDNQRQYMMIHEGGWPSDSCASWTYVGKVGSKDDCAAASRDKNMRGFSIGNLQGNGRAYGYCYTEGISVTTERWADWSANRTNPACPSGEWLSNPYYDTYAINPATVATASTE